MKHIVKFSLAERELGNSDIEFAIKKGGNKFGILKVSKGSIVWVQKDNTYGYRVGWDKFDELFNREGKREKKK